MSVSQSLNKIHGMDVNLFVELVQNFGAGGAQHTLGS